MNSIKHSVELKNISYGRNEFKFQKKVQNFYSLLFTLFAILITSSGVSAQTSFNPENPEIKNILQKCIDLPDLQQFYPKQSNGKSYALKVMQHGVSFPPSIIITHDSNSVLFLSKTQINANSEDAYFYFNEFFIESNKARVDFTFYYDLKNAAKMQVISLEFQKNSSGWFISNKKTETR